MRKPNEPYEVYWSWMSDAYVMAPSRYRITHPKRPKTMFTGTRDQCAAWIVRHNNTKHN